MMLLLTYDTCTCYCHVIVLPCCFGCCELASTFNVLTWRVMPDLQALLWTRRTTSPVLTGWDVSQPVSLWSGVLHRRCCSAAVVIPLLESSTAAWCRAEASLRSMLCLR